MDHASNPTANPPSRDSIPSSDVEPLRNGDGFDEYWGDFVDSEYEFDIEAVSKDVNLYPRGICYLIQIDEVLASRYRILHKLGHYLVVIFAVSITFIISSWLLGLSKRFTGPSDGTVHI
ncbi:hypothetical protein BFJ66_g7231 [Fusarium oxysporum f. sp. cepae]|uniref:Uncharacterized protein n=2 Tax=Fusarium oxysporum TaxID=5507 RepID=A0A3L6P783_FUSOX|nr:hypothetical protein FOZG_02263 [Fusarium oxysporum Fo47]RKK29176.1 hypothetical protein BFJ65_g1111 [Fusarium oxysporum f. sp. cepae]RKK49180.1 hypothetical protein BFJ66_g7231 [Fusarium oxysporum f. sp. cepae]